jgi:putative glutathione S-transferase
LFKALDKVEDMLEGHDYLIGYRFTFIDLRLFMCLIRFDSSYVLVYKCNKRTISSYKNLRRYVRHLYHDVGLVKYIFIVQIKKGYYSLKGNNPNQIVAFGPDPWWQIKNE